MRKVFTRSRACALLATVTLVGAVSGARAADNRYLLATQDSWETHRGFYLDLENNGTNVPGAPAAADAKPFNVETMRLALGAADGSTWRFAGVTPPWEMNHPYHVRAVIDSTGLSLTLDGKEVARAEGVTLAPQTGDITAASTPEWANGPASYTVSQQSLTITSAGKTVLTHTWPTTDGNTAIAQALFSPPPAFTSAAGVAPGKPLTVDVVFSLQSQASDLHALAPFVDRYGQDRYGTWPGKVTSDAQLKSDADDEQRRLASMPPPTDLDEYGGSKTQGWSEPGSGFYRVVNHNGVWWLITPNGLPCFYTGMCDAPILEQNGTPVKGREDLFAELPPQTGPFAPAWSAGPWGETGNRYFAFDTANLIRKYGQSHWREAASNVCVQRLRAFGFSGLGKWTDAFGHLPYTGVLLHPGDPKSGKGKLDVFDPAACDRFRSTMAAQIEPHRRDPLLLGWSVGNEMDEIVRTDEMVAMLAAPTATPAKIAIVQQAIDTIYGHDVGKFAAAWHAPGDSPQQLATAPLTAPAADLEPLRQFYAAAYYRFIYKTIKSLDSDHLYLGFWIVPGWWMNDSDWGLIAPYCDVIGYDHYDSTFADAHLLGLMKQTAKPVLCGEFSFPPTYDGTRGYGVYTQANTATEADAGQRYAQWLHDAARNPYCVGTMWFEYRDEPLTGRGPGMGPNLLYDEHYAFGIVDVTDKPKWDLVTAMRAANLGVTAERAAASTGSR